MSGPEVGQSGGKAVTAKKRPAGKGSPPARSSTLGALRTAQHERVEKKPKGKESAIRAASKRRSEPLKFRVAADFRRAFKRAAAAQDCKKVEFLERIFAEWNARNPL